MGICLIFTSLLDWDYAFLGEYHRGEVPSSSHHVKATYVYLIYHCWCWLADVVFLILFPTFPYCTLWKEDTMHRQHLRSFLNSVSQELWSLSFRVEYLHKLFLNSFAWEISFFSPIYLFIQSFFILVRTHGFLLYMLVYNPTLLYFVAQIVPAFCHWEFFQLALLLLWYTTPLFFVCFSISLLSGTTRWSGPIWA